MRIIELFGGIGACTQALRRIGIDVEVVDYVEIDKYAVASYNSINNTNYEPQDICEWNKTFDDIDLIMHGSPCQDFSVAGKGLSGDEGSNTRSSLMWETVRIVGNIMPKYVVWENVKNVISKKHKHNFYKYINRLDELGYNSYYKVLNSKDYGIAQNRERVYTISIRKDIDDGTFEFPQPIELTRCMDAFLDDEVDEKYYITTEKAQQLIATLLAEGKLPEEKSVIDLTVNEPRADLDVANCIKARYDAGISNFKADGTGVVENER